jgi:hypothetical protein
MRARFVYTPGKLWHVARVNHGVPKFPSAVIEDAVFLFAKAQARGTRARRRVLNAAHKR